MTHTSMKLRLAMVFVKDPARMSAFYREGLGLTVEPDRSSDGWVVFDAQGSLFALHAIPEPIARDIRIEDPPRPRGDTPIKLVFETPDLPEACRRIVAAGGFLLREGMPGSRDAIDPEGNVFQVTVPDTAE